MKKIIIISIYAIALSMFSCRKDKADAPVETINCDSVTVTFNLNVQPIFLSNCATSGCHDATTASSGYVLETYSQISANAEASLSSMKYESGYTEMPYFSSKLHDTLINQVQCWIQDGKPNN